MRIGTTFLGFALVGAAVLILLTALFLNSNKSDMTLVFSPLQVLSVTWEGYKAYYLEEGTLRALDRQRENITTSEGQSYTMLRAVWLGDKATFDTAWQWTKDNLQHESDDTLLSWLFGQHEDGSWGVLTERGGHHSANDANVDIALALIFAHARWQDPTYLGDARALIADIWEKEVIVINGVPYMAAGDQEKNSTNPVALINPSYLHPAAYRIFARVDTERPWLQLVDSTYQILSAGSLAPLDAGRSANLPPDWVAIDKATGAPSAPTVENLTTNYGFDAMRVPWRIALDAVWFGDSRAKEYLESLSFLRETWKRTGRLASTYTHAGEVVESAETAAMYGTAIGHFMVADPAIAKDIYEQKLIFLYDPGKNDWKERLTYYDENWAWFGIGLYNNLLPNLAANMPESAYNSL